MGACGRDDTVQPWRMTFTGYKDGSNFRSACFELSASNPIIGIKDKQRTACNSKAITRIDFELSKSRVGLCASLLMDKPFIVVLVDSTDEPFRVGW